MPDSGIHQAGGRFWVSQVARDQQGFSSMPRAQLLRQGFGLGGGSLIMQGELAAFRGEMAGNGGTYPAGGASDKNDFSGSFQEVSMRAERPDFLTHSHGARKTSLPVPDADALAHSAALLTHIRREIDAAGGMISFRRYMELALYTPGLGYYMAGQTRFGAAGDFVTAPEMGRVLAAVLARTLRPDLGPDGILEFGGGSGALAGQIRDILPDTPYTLLEPSPDLQARQQATVPGVLHLQTLPEHWRGVMLAHEVLDAMPVQVLELGASGQLHECGVRWNGAALDWATLPPPVAAPLAARLAPYVTHWPRPYRTEINLTAEFWLREVAARLDSGAILLIDYGHEAAEYYHPQRQTGSLRAYYRHHWLDDPFYLPGLCDLTAHVDFTALMTAAVEAGLEVAFYGHLARFLVEHGLAEVYGTLCAQTGDDGRFALNNEIKRLTLPQEMGESFKVLILKKRENA
jgi:SAM-dependent MidA family methyltransferase